MPKIIQILQGNAVLTGLGDDGVVYAAMDDKWVEWIKPLPKTVKKRDGQFKKPSGADVQEEMEAKGLSNFDAAMEAAKFFDFYESNGWKVGKNPMKDWKAAVRNWLKNVEKSQAAQLPTGRTHKQEARAAISGQVMQISDTNW